MKLSSPDPFHLTSNQQGFTLIEVLISMVILSVGILATSQLQLSFMQSNVKARIMTLGTAQAQEKIEELMSLPYDDANFDLGTPPHTDTTDPTYTYTWTVTDNAAAEVTDLGTGALISAAVPGTIKTVNVTVSWTEKNVQRQVTYTFIKANM